jgi:hypothetical protein
MFFIEYGVLVLLEAFVIPAVIAGATFGFMEPKLERFPNLVPQSLAAGFGLDLTRPFIE